MEIPKKRMKLNETRKCQKRIPQGNIILKMKHNTMLDQPEYGAPCYKDLNEELRHMKDEERREEIRGFTESYIAYRARVARQDDTPVTKSMVYSKMQGGKGTKTDIIMDTGCTYPLNTTALTEALGIEVKHLTGSLEIIGNY